MAMEALKADFEKEFSSYKQIEKDREKYISNRQTLESQLTENKMVKEELDFLEDDAKIFKLIGAVLVRVDVGEARGQVEKRLEYITGERKRIEDSLSDSAEKLKNAQNRLKKLQENIQKAAAAK